MNANILPTLDELHHTLDIRIKGRRIAEIGLPMHGSAREIAAYYELLLKRKVISKPVRDDLLAFFAEHSKPLSNRFNHCRLKFHTFP